MSAVGQSGKRNNGVMELEKGGKEHNFERCITRVIGDLSRLRKEMNFGVRLTAVKAALVVPVVVRMVLVARGEHLNRGSAIEYAREIVWKTPAR